MLVGSKVKKKTNWRNKTAPFARYSSQELIKLIISKLNELLHFSKSSLALANITD